jgi:DNA primase
MPVVDFVLQQAEARHDLKTAQGKAAAAEEIVDVLAGIASPIEQDHYTNVAADRLNVEPGAVRRLLRSKRQRTAPPVETASPQAVEVRGDPDDDYLLALLMRLRAVAPAQPEPPAIVGPIDFVLPQSRELYRALGSEVPEELEPYARRARERLAEAQLVPQHQLMEAMELQRLRIRERLLETQRQQLRALLSEGGLAGQWPSEDLEEASRLLDQFRREAGDVAQQLPPEQKSAGMM